MNGSQARSGADAWQPRCTSSEIKYNPVQQTLNLVTVNEGRILCHN